MRAQWNIYGTGFLGGLMVLFVPAIVRAADACDAVTNPLKGLICDFGEIITRLIGITATLALLVFFWGLVKYILAAGNEKSQVDGKKIMVSGTIAIFVLFSVFGIVAWLQNIFGIDPTKTTQTTPTITFPQ